MLHQIWTQSLQHQIADGHHRKQSAFVAYTSNIQIIGLTKVPLEDVVCLLTKEDSQDQFITVKSVM
jgi:hypothetical protein